MFLLISFYIFQNHLAQTHLFKKQIVIVSTSLPCHNSRKVICNGNRAEWSTRTHLKTCMTYERCRCPITGIQLEVVQIGYP